MKTDSGSEALEIRSSVLATRGDGERLFLQHDELALSFKGGKLRLAGKKRPGVFRVRLEDVKEIQWRANGSEVDFRVEDQIYHVPFHAPEVERAVRKMAFWTLFGMLGVFIVFHLMKRRHGEFAEANSREADKWRAILKSSENDH